MRSFLAETRGQREARWPRFQEDPGWRQELIQFPEDPLPRHRQDLTLRVICNQPLRHKDATGANPPAQPRLTGLKTKAALRLQDLQHARRRAGSPHPYLHLQLLRLLTQHRHPILHLQPRDDQVQQTGPRVYVGLRHHKGLPGGCPHPNYGGIKQHRHPNHQTHGITQKP